MRFRILFALAAVFLTPLAAELKKVIIMPIINIEKDANYAYLEGSITDSLKERLREKFAFEEMPEAQWAKVAEQNFILRDDFHTRTAAMNLGILANQDIVIHGGFRPVNKKVGVGIKASILATAYILDVKKKRVVSTIEVTLPADSELFTAVSQVADRMEGETRKIIPSKEEAARSNFKVAGAPIFADPTIGLNVGGGYYFAGYAKYFTAQLPVLGATFRLRMPRFSERLYMQTDFVFMNHKLKEGSDSALQSLGVSSTTSNYMLSVSAGYQIPFKQKWYFEPQLGGGYVLQSTSVTGSGINSTLGNGFPFGRASFVTGYHINAFIDALFTINVVSYIESSTVTVLPLGLLGIHYKF